MPLHVVKLSAAEHDDFIHGCSERGLPTEAFLVAAKELAQRPGDVPARIVVVRRVHPGGEVSIPYDAGADADWVRRALADIDVGKFGVL